MHKYKRGIIAHIGPMFGGKTSGLLADVRKMKIAGYKVDLFKPKKDNRYSDDKIINHDGESLDAINVDSFREIVEHVTNKDINVIAIDEYQFIASDKEPRFKTAKEAIEFDRFTVHDFIQWIINNKKTLIISGLDLDSDMNPFNNIKNLLPYATHIIKHKAVCTSCGSDATLTYCRIEKNSQDLVGGKDIYEPLCLNCYLEKRN